MISINKQQDNNKKDNFFIVAVEGATTDGREIERLWIEQMAQDYDPAYHTALINLEHIKHQSPTSIFRRYGEVQALKAQELTDGKLAGKLALFAQISPTAELVELHKARQKLFASVEVSPDFAGTGRAYLVGLGVTDDPASLGTEILRFSATAKNNLFKARKLQQENLFSAADFEINLFNDDALSVVDPDDVIAAVVAKVEETEEQEEAASFSARLSKAINELKAVFSKHAQASKEAQEEAHNFKQIKEAFNDSAQATMQLLAVLNDLNKEQVSNFKDHEIRIANLENQPLEALRPKATGGGGVFCTDC